MTPTSRSGAARVRVLAALALGAALGLLVPSLTTTTGPSSSVAVAVAAALLVLAVSLLQRRVAVPAARIAPAHVGAPEDNDAVSADRATDPLHHPLRPRAPGLV